MQFFSPKSVLPGLSPESFNYLNSFYYMSVRTSLSEISRICRSNHAEHVASKRVLTEVSGYHNEFEGCLEISYTVREQMSLRNDPCGFRDA